MPQPQSLRKGWTLHEAKGQQASDEASDESQEGLLRLTCNCARMIWMP
jgi:hypothetical protein